MRLESGTWTRLKQLGATDVLAGVSVAVVLIPQSLAFAELAGLPAYVGLAAAALPPIAAAFLASSPHLQTGPTAVTSLLTFGALSGLAAPRTTEYAALAPLLALLVGVIRIGLGFGRFGWLAYLMSQPVLRGFTSGAALVIISSQLPAALGSEPPTRSLLAGAWWAATHVGDWELASLALTMVTLALIFGGQRIHGLFPGVAVALGVGLGFSLASGYAGPTIGTVPQGFPVFPAGLPLGSVPYLLVPALVIAVVGFAEPAAIARTHAVQDRRLWDPDRELISQGAANVAAALSSAFPVGGSFSRSALGRLAGGRTRWAGLVTGVAVLLSMPAAHVLSPLPRAVLAGVVIAAVVRLLALRSLWALRAASPPQALVAWSTFGLTILLAPHVEMAVILGVSLALIVHIWREMRVHVRVRYAGDTLRLELRGVLFFGSAPAVHYTLVRALARHPSARRLVLDLGSLGRIDYTGALVLRDVVAEARAAGLQVETVATPPHAWKLLKRMIPS